MTCAYLKLCKYEYSFITSISNLIYESKLYFHILNFDRLNYMSCNNIFIHFILLGTYNGDIRSPLVHENINRFLVRIFRHSNQQISTLGGGNKYELDTKNYFC